ncbi:MAG TPA: hypothetical protein VFU31_26070 [Candidatus Binatia bacterium]|nr:hypothetical protein [Candidatus Binatia bacterium]
MDRTSKQLRKMIGDWSAIAHDRELVKALRELRGEFDRWERGEIDPIELSDRIHKFHQGPARDLWVRYTTNPLDPQVAYAVATGILSKDEIPAELLQHLTNWLNFYEGLQRESEKDT